MYIRQVSQYSVLEIALISDSKLFACCFDFVHFDCVFICVFQN